MLRVVGRLPLRCDCAGLGRQVSDKPQGRKPREDARDGLASASYGDFKAGGWFCCVMTVD